MYIYNWTDISFSKIISNSWLQDKEEAVEAPSTTTSLQCHHVSSVKRCNIGTDTSKREGNIDSEAEVKYQTNGSGPEEFPTNVWRWDLHHTHTELIPDYSFTLLFSELRRNIMNVCLLHSGLAWWGCSQEIIFLFSSWYYSHFHCSHAYCLNLLK